VHRLVKILLQRSDSPWPAGRQRKLVKWLIFCSNWSDLIDDLLAQVQQTPAAENCLDKLLEKLEVQPDKAGEFNRLKKFAGYKDVLSAEDVDGDFSLAAYISQMVRDSAAPMKKASKQYGYLDSRAGDLQS
jgi:hypothetical protein